MGNQSSKTTPGAAQNADSHPALASSNDKTKYKSFPGSAILEKTFCGSIDTTDPSEYHDETLANKLLRKADLMCVSSPDDKKEPWHDTQEGTYMGIERNYSNSSPPSSGSGLLARALVNEVTDNPNTMNHTDLQAREKKLLKAQQAHEGKKVGAPGAGVGPPHVLQSVAYALTGQDEPPTSFCMHPSQAQQTGGAHNAASSSTGNNRSLDLHDEVDPGQELHARNPHAITIALCLSRRYATIGHPDTITRQTAFDFNELQDRSYKYVSATDQHGWRGGGGEGEGPPVEMPTSPNSVQQQATPAEAKTPHADTVHIPILHMDCPNAETVDQVIHALASGDIFIPHMSVLPDSLSVQGTPLPDLKVCWNCERNDDIPPDQWPNWCLEFMHNQLYEYFYNSNAKPIWMPRPFGLTLAKSVRWKTVKHMNKYFLHAENVLEEWRNQGPQCLDPQHSYMDGGASPEEVARPHGIYLFRKGEPGTDQLVPTNYFCPNFSPPYTSKMTRSLLQNVLGKSWNQSRREWSSTALPVLVSPSSLLAAACGCTAPDAGGFVAKEVTEEHVFASGTSGEYYSGASGEDFSASRSKSADYTNSASEESSAKEHDRQQVSAESIEKDDVEDQQQQSPSQRVLDANEAESVNASSNSENDGDAVADVQEMAEEKKSEDEIRKKAARMSLDASTSGFMSVAASGTTVMHANSGGGQVSPPHDNFDQDRLYSDEDWASEASSQAHSYDPPGDKVRLLRRQQSRCALKIQSYLTSSFFLGVIAKMGGSKV